MQATHTHSNASVGGCWPVGCVLLAIGEVHQTGPQWLLVGSHGWPAPHAILLRLLLLRLLPQLHHLCRLC